MNDVLTSQDMKEPIREPKFLIEKLNDGLSFGEGGISTSARREQIDPENYRQAEEALASEAILIPLDVDKDGNILDDDGCPDGRRWKKIFAGTAEKLRSLSRSKVFGGGATMAAASRIGLGKAAGKSLNETFSESIDALKDARIGFGAHTDDHDHEATDCGCGAIDKAPVIIANTVKYEEEIRNTIGQLGVDTFGLDEVYKNYSDYSQEIKEQPYNGKKVSDEIIGEGKIVKQLTDKHKEMAIVLNMVEDHTIDQELIRQVSNDEVQVFAVDVWRMQKIANELYDDPIEAHKAFLSELVYTLGVSATLTAGDLPVYRISKAEQLVAA